MKPIYLDEEWLRRRSERIFLSDPSPQPSPNYTPLTQQQIKPTGHQQTTATPKITKVAKPHTNQAKLQKAKSIKELTDKVKKKYSKTLQKSCDRSEVSRLLVCKIDFCFSINVVDVISGKYTRIHESIGCNLERTRSPCRFFFQQCNICRKLTNHVALQKRPLHKKQPKSKAFIDTDSSESESDADNIPLSVLRDRPHTPGIEIIA